MVNAVISEHNIRSLDLAVILLVGLVIKPMSYFSNLNPTIPYRLFHRKSFAFVVAILQYPGWM